MAAGNISRVGARVAWTLGAQNTASFTFALNDDRYTKEEIANAIIETEAELVRDFADAYHPQRASLLSWIGPINNGGVVPDHIGNIEAIRLQGVAITFSRSSGNIFTTTSTASLYTGQGCRVSTSTTLPTGLSAATDYNIIVLSTTTFSLATTEANAIAGTAISISGAGSGTQTLTPWVIGESTSRTNIREWRANPTIFTEGTEGHFNNTNGTLEFTGTLAEIKAVQYTPTFNTLANSGTVDAALQIDSKWEGLLAVGAVPKLVRQGVSSGVIETCAGLYNAGRAALRSGDPLPIGIAQATQ